MADAAFVDMEVEAESPSAPLLRRTASAQRNDKLNVLTSQEEAPMDDTPLLGPPAMTGDPDKRWYNTASVYFPRS